MTDTKRASSFSSLFPWSPRLLTLHSHAKRWLYFSLTTGAIILCLSNSLTRAAQSVWTDAGNVWQRIWDAVLSLGLSNATLFIAGSSLLHMTVYWSHALLLTFFDTLSDRHALSRYKIQTTKNVPVDREKLHQCVWQVLVNQLLVACPMNAASYPLAVLAGVSIDGPLPLFSQFLYDLAVFLVIEEILFYYLHRAMHCPLLYGVVHKRHHEWTAPIAVATNYCHPLEHALCNLLPVMLGPIVCGSHLAVIWIWQLIATFTSINTHSGYHLPFMPSPEAHDFHHLRFNVNYGVMGVLDWLHGTDQSFKQALQFKNHKTLFGLDYEPVVPKKKVASGASISCGARGDSSLSQSVSVCQSFDSSQYLRQSFDSNQSLCHSLATLGEKAERTEPQ